MPPLNTRTEKGNSCGCFPKQDASSCNPYIKLTCSNEQHLVARSMHCVAGYPTMYRYFDIPHPPPQKISCCCRCKYCCRQPPKQKCCISGEKSIQTDVKALNDQTTQCPEDPVQVVEEKLTVVTKTKSVTRVKSMTGSTMDKDVPEERHSAEEKTTKQIKTYSESEALHDLDLIDTQKEEMEGSKVRTSTDSNKDKNQGKHLIQTDVKDTNEQTTTPLKDGKVHMEKAISVTRFYSDGKISTEMDNLSSGSALSKNVPEDKPIKTPKRKPDLATDELDLVNTQKEEKKEVTSVKTDSKKDKDTNEETKNAKQIDKNKTDHKTTQPMTKFYPAENVSTEMDMSSKTDSEDLDTGRKTSGMSDDTPGEFQIPQMLEKPNMNPTDLQPDDNAVPQIDTPTKSSENLNKSNTAIKDSSGSRLNQPDNISEKNQAETTDTYLLDNTSNVTSDRERGYEDYAKDTESSESFKQNDSTEDTETLHPTETRKTNDEDPLNESAEVSNEESGNKIIEESDEEKDLKEVRRENCSCCRMLPRILPYNPCPFHCKQCLCRHRNIYGCMPWQAYPVGSESNTTRWLPNCPPQRRQ